MMPDKSPFAIANNFVDQIRRAPGLGATLKILLKQLALKNASFYACGGMIRDAAISELTGQPIESSDFDFVCEGLAIDSFIEILESLAADTPEVDTVIHVGKSFPVWKLKVTGLDDMVDMALTRTEASFGDHHRDFTVNAEFVSIQDDSVRRDFTINAMYVRLFLNESGDIAGELLDLHGGLEDTKKRLINCVGRPEDRFREDPLRMLRAVRFAARFPGFSIGEVTAEAASILAPSLIQTISRERIGGELYKMLKASPEQSLQDLSRLRILPEIIPQLVPLSNKRLVAICSRICELQNDGKELDQKSLYAALLFDLAADELSGKMASSMVSNKMPRSFFSTTIVRSITRQLRLPGIKEIAALCDDALLLLHYGFLEDADAAVEEIFRRFADIDALFGFCHAHQRGADEKYNGLRRRIVQLPASQIDFNNLLKISGIPKGPHLQRLKLGLRQAEIDGRIASEQDAVELLNETYLADTHLLQGHADKLHRQLASIQDCQWPVEVRDEIRWLLFTKPLRLVQAYLDNDLLKAVLPEIAEADEVVRMTDHHFATSHVNDTLLALGILSEEVDWPTPAQILSVLFLDVGKAKTYEVAEDGRPTYYNHEHIGADMAYRACIRLGIDQTIASDVFFIIRNHNALVIPGGPNRLKKLIGSVDDGLIDDLLLVHRVDQLAKMPIHDGVRIDEGQLDHYRHIMDNLEQWRLQAAERSQNKRPNGFAPLVSGHDLQKRNPLWGPGLCEGPTLGAIKLQLDQLQAKQLFNTRAEGLKIARNHIVLHHLSVDPAGYIGTLMDHGELETILPEIANLIGLAQTGPYHQEDAYTHTINVIRNLPVDASVELKLAAVFHDVGKAETRTFDQKTGACHFYGHEKKSLEILEEVYQRFCWSDLCFDQIKVNWLVANHIRVQSDWTKINNPKKSIERMFFRHNQTGNRIPASFRLDLLRLRKADSSGAEVEDSTISQFKEHNIALLERLMAEVADNLDKKEAQAAEHERVGRYWNGKLVLEHFQVGGPEVGRLLRLGQDFVKDMLKDGKEPYLADILKHINEQDRGKQQ